MSVKLNPGAADAAVLAAASRGVRKGTEIVKREIIRKIIEDPKTGRVYGNHQASAPGEAPATDTGRHLQGIISSFDETEIKGTVASTVEYAAHLELGTENMAARPHMRVSLEEKRKEVVAVIQSELDKVRT